MCPGFTIPWASLAIPFSPFFLVPPFSPFPARTLDAAAFKIKIQSLIAAASGRAVRTRTLSAVEMGADQEAKANLAVLLLEYVHVPLLATRSHVHDRMGDRRLIDPFRKLPNARTFPTYYDMIKNPIDMDTIEAGLWYLRNTSFDILLLLRYVPSCSYPNYTTQVRPVPIDRIISCRCAAPLCQRPHFQ